VRCEAIGLAVERLRQGRCSVAFIPFSKPPRRMELELKEHRVIDDGAVLLFFVSC
jgi:hypothetical protein